MAGVPIGVYTRSEEGGLTSLDLSLDIAMHPDTICYGLADRGGLGCRRCISSIKRPKRHFLQRENRESTASEAVETHNELLCQDCIDNGAALLKFIRFPGSKRNSDNSQKNNPTKLACRSLPSPYQR